MTGRYNARPRARPMRWAKDHELVVTVTYAGLRASQFFSNDSEEAIMQLKLDLTELKFPFPKTDNISFVSHGCMTAFWIAPLDSHVYRSLYSAVNQEPAENQPSFRLYTPDDLQRLGITKIFLDTHPHRPNGSQGSTTGHQEIPASTSRTHENQGQTRVPLTRSQNKKRQAAQGIAQSSNSNASSGVKRPAPQDDEITGKRDPNLNPNKRVRVESSTSGASRGFGTGANAIAPGPRPPVGFPHLRFGATTQLGGTAWQSQDHLSSGLPPFTPRSTQWNHQQAQVPGMTLAQSNPQQTIENSSIPQAQLHQFRSNPWRLTQPLQPNPTCQTPVVLRGHWRLNPSDEQAGATATTLTPQFQPQPSGGITRQPQDSQTPQKTHNLSTSGDLPAAAIGANNPAPAVSISDLHGQQQQQQSGNVVSPRPVGPATTSNETDGPIQQLQGRLATVRRELEAQLQRELLIYQQIQQIEPAPALPRDKALLTSVDDLQSRVAELEKMLQDARQKMDLVQGSLGVVQRGRKKVSDELLEERRSRADVEEQLNNERAALAQTDEELQKERTLRLEAEAQLQSERKGRAEIDEELRKERMLRVEVEGHLRNERQGRAGNERQDRTEIDKELQKEQTLREEAEARLENERKSRAEIDAELQAERKSRMDVEAELKVVRTRVVVGTRQTAETGGSEPEVEIGKLKQEDPWDQLEDERKRRLKLEESLREEQRRRVEAEHVLKDVERECRAPFVVPALLEAFSTISRITSRALEANSSHIISRGD